MIEFMPSIDELREEVVQLNRCSVQHNPEANLKESIYRFYQAKVLARLNKIISSNKEEPKKALELEAFLISNWGKINGSMLSYTAIPSKPITKLLCKVAAYLGSTKPYVDLNETQNTLKYLMPGIRVISEIEVPQLDSNWLSMSAEEVLLTHILGSEGIYLLPLALMNTLNLTELGELKILNPYFDVTTDDSTLAFLNQNEYRRLFLHSELSYEVRLARQNYLDKVAAKGDLLSALMHLCQELLKTGLEGAGSEEAATLSGEMAIRSFINYYSMLSQEHKLLLPPKLLTEIKLLKQCIGQYEKGEQSIVEMQLCLSTRRRDLLAAIKGHEKQLSQIKLQRAERGSTVEQALERLDQAMENFNLNYFSDSTYELGRKGSDKIALSNQLIRKIDYEVPIESLDSVIFYFSDLSKNEISSLMALKPVNNMVFNAINYGRYAIAHLASLIFSFTPEQFRGLTAYLSGLLPEFIFKNDELANLLLAINDLEKLKAFCEFLQRDKPHFLKRPSNVRAIATRLTGGALDVWLKFFIKDIQLSFVSVRALALFLQDLNDEQFRTVFPFLQKRMVRLMTDFVDLTDLSIVLPDVEFKKLCDELNESSHYFLESVPEFTTFLQSTRADRLQIFFSSFHEKYLKLFIDSGSFVKVLNRLPPTKQLMLLNLYNDHFSTLILKPSQSRAVYRIILDKASQVERGLLKQLERKFGWPIRIHHEVIGMIYNLKARNHLEGALSNANSDLNRRLAVKTNACCGCLFFSDPNEMVLDPNSTHAVVPLKYG